MLSVILYGRNDSHGYNLHKRAAISLNAIAHLLSDPDDEIIFVDYNTPDDLPTFPEAIADTLTPAAIEKLRVLRVRPDVHTARFGHKTHLVALEPIARNAAIRRSNPKNRWVLSTNTDMIFVPKDGKDLTKVVAGLRDGFYHLLHNILEAAPSRRPGSVQAILSPDAGRGADSRLIRLEDWEDHAWVALARTLFTNRDHGNLFERERWTWERVTLAQNLFRAFPARDRPRVLVGGRLPERLAFVLAHMGCTVDIVDPEALGRGERGAVDWRGDYASEGWVSPEPVGLLADRPADYLYDAVILPYGGLWGGRRQAAGRVLKHASDLLRPGGHLGLGALCQVFEADGRVLPYAVPAALVREGVLSQAVADLSDFKPTGRSDGRLTPRTFDRLREAPADDGGPPALLEGPVPEVEATGVWSFVKDVNPKADWVALGHVLEEGVYDAAPPRGVEDGGAQAFDTATGPASDEGLFTRAEREAVDHAAETPAAGLFASLRPQGTVARTPTAIYLRAADSGVLAVTGSLGRLAPGYYELGLDLDARAVPTPGPLLAIGVVGAAGVVLEHIHNADAAGRIRIDLEFEVGPEGRRGLGLLLKSLGGAEIDILDAVVR